MRYEIAYKESPAGSGYGVFRRRIAAGIAALGEDVGTATLPSLYDALELRTGPIEYRTKRHRFKRYLDERRLPGPEERADHSARTRPDTVRICPDTPDVWQWQGAGKRIGFTMFETSALPINGPYSWLPGLRSADTVIVPCEHNRAVFLGHGLEDVRTVPLAIDKEWQYYDRRERIADIRSGSRPFIFLLLGEIGYRKGYDLALEAFGRVFANDRRAHLVIKTRGQSPFIQRRIKNHRDNAHGAPYAWTIDKEAAPNVTVLRGDWSRKRLQALYNLADCFVWPSRGEGYGLPPREAAATGLPVLSPDHTGMDDAREWAYVIETERTEPARYRNWGVCGNYLVPSIPHLADLMLETYRDYERALDFGAVASRYVRQRDWLDVARDVMDIAEKEQEDA